MNQCDAYCKRFLLDDRISVYLCLFTLYDAYESTNDITELCAWDRIELLYFIRIYPLLPK
jgi:hypothetical protein